MAASGLAPGPRRGGANGRRRSSAGQGLQGLPLRRGKADEKRAAGFDDRPLDEGGVTLQQPRRRGGIDAHLFRFRQLAPGSAAPVQQNFPPDPAEPVGEPAGRQPVRTPVGKAVGGLAPLEKAPRTEERGG